MTINLTVTALLRFKTSQDRVTLGEALIADEEWKQQFKAQFDGKTDFKVHTPDKITSGRSFVDEAGAQEWLDFIVPEAASRGIQIAQTKIVPYIGEIHLEFLPV